MDLDSETVVVYEPVCPNPSPPAMWPFVSVAVVLVMIFAKIGFALWDFLRSLKERERALDKEYLELQKEKENLDRLRKDQELRLREQWVAFQLKHLKNLPAAASLQIPEPPSVGSPVPEPAASEPAASEPEPERIDPPTWSVPSASPAAARTGVRPVDTSPLANRRLVFPDETPADGGGATEDEGANDGTPEDEENDEYEIEMIVNYDSRGYEVKWKGAPESENQWIKAKQLHNAQGAIRDFWLRRIAENCPYQPEAVTLKLNDNSKITLELGSLKLHCVDYLKYGKDINPDMRDDLMVIIEQIGKSIENGENSRFMEVPRDSWYEWCIYLNAEEQLYCLHQHIHYFLKEYFDDNRDKSLVIKYFHNTWLKKAGRGPYVKEYDPLKGNFDMIGRYMRFLHKRRVFQ
jgi:hypothetical protein